MRSRPRALPGVLLGLATLLLAAAPAAAGGGPETVLVVVNADSPASLAVANAYVARRQIPATHVCPLHGVPGTGVIGVDVFRERIWAPIEAFIAEHGLVEEIDVIAYSADFPFGVDYDADFQGQDLPQGVHKFRVASLTGMTYLINRVKAKSREYLDLSGNQYFRYPRDGLLPGHGFRHGQVWAREEKPRTDVDEKDHADRYYLATLLGFTGVQGNTVPEILACLENGAACDGRKPDGTVYLMRHKDIRAQTRMPLFKEAVRALEALGRKAVELEEGEQGQDGKVPIAKEDVIGCVAGIAGFNWPASKSTMLPGCIAEHLTSFGAKFDGSGQTKISEFLRAGAVGSSGAVTEPYAIPHKFPTAFLHVHYAEGCSLAESFYQSVSGPYQLLVVGDPLARPYADFARVSLKSPDAKGAWKETVEVLAEVEPAKDKAIRAVELWVDGGFVASAAPGAAIPLDTTTLCDGHHDLRLVAVEDSLVETRSFARVLVEVRNGKQVVTIKAPRSATDLGDEVKLSGKASKAKAVEIVAGHRVLAAATRSGSTWKAEVPSEALGVGTVEVQARAVYEDGAVALSEPVALEVTAGVATAEARSPKRRPAGRKPRKGEEPKKAKGQAGLEATVTDAQGKEHTFVVTSLGGQGKDRFLGQVQAQAKGAPKKIVLTGELEVPQDGLYELALNAAGKIAIEVGGHEVFAHDALAFDAQAYAALPLEAGWHALRIVYEPTGGGDLAVLLAGAQVAQVLGGKAIRH